MKQQRNILLLAIISGMQVWSANTITECISKYKPSIVEEMDATITSEVSEISKVREIFPNVEKVSVVYAVMEPVSKVGMVYIHPTDFGWSNLGNWASLHDKLQKDEFIMAQLVTFTCTNARIMWFM